MFKKDNKKLVSYKLLTLDYIILYYKKQKTLMYLERSKRR